MKREGLSAIPTRRFMNNYAYFQIVLLAYNIWRSFKMLAEHSERRKRAEEQVSVAVLSGIQDNTIRIARLKLLMIAAKLVTSGNTTKLKYSEHDSRAAGLFSFMGHLDRIRNQVSPWLTGGRMAMSAYRACEAASGCQFILTERCKKFLAQEWFEKRGPRIFSHLSVLCERKMPGPGKRTATRPADGAGSKTILTWRENYVFVQDSGRNRF